jgi:hypothetical protein
MRCTLIGVAAAVTLAAAASLALAQTPDREKGPAAQDRSPQDKGQRQPGRIEGPRATETPKGTDQPRPQPKSTEQPGKEQPKATERPDKDRPKATERPDRDRPKATERPDRDRPKATERPDRDRPKATERPDKDRPKATERPDRDRPKATERPDKDRPRATERPDRDRPKAAERPDKDRQKSAQPDTGKDRQGRVQVSEKQRSDVGVRLRQTRVDKTRVNISVNIGSPVPRTVRLRPLPAAIITLAPAYRGYSYVVLEDDTIAIIDARTYVVVDVIPTDTRRVERPGPLALSAEQMRFIYERVPKDRTANVRIRLALGAEVPRNVELLRFPSVVVERVPEVRRYRYIVAADDVAIVDPTDNAVVLVISE